MIAEKYEEAGYGKDVLASAKEYVGRGTEHLGGIVEERPQVALLSACLAGFAVGLVLTQIFIGRSSSKSFDQPAAEKFGQSLFDRLERSMPAIVRERFLQ